MVYASHCNTRSTPQTKPIPGKKMVANDGGGFSFAVDCWTRLERFLILGCEGGHFQVGEQKMTVENAQSVMECARLDTLRTIITILEISESGRAPKNDPAIFALALLASMTDRKPTYTGELANFSSLVMQETVSAAALTVLPRVCRIYTHLAQFIANVQQLRGWGRGLRNAVARWYNDKEVKSLAFQMTKYQDREGFSQRDVLRLSHPKTTDPARNTLYSWAVGKCQMGIGPEFARIGSDEPLGVLWALAAVKQATNVDQVIDLIHDYGLVREHIPTEWLNSPAVWDALLHKMPPTAMIRNLGKMTSIGLIAPMSSAASMVINRLRDAQLMSEARVHPFSLLLASTTYSAGKGVKGDLTWKPNVRVVDALDEAFYQSFKYVEPTGKRHYLAIDVSGSMGWANSRINNTHITARVGAACMAMVTLRTEELSYAMAFHHGMVDLGLTPSMSLKECVQRCDDAEFGATDCAAPIVDAMNRNIPVDVFVVYTDSDTNCPTMHPVQALKKYRDKTGINAKLAVVAMVANPHSIADPNDAGMLDISGFDADSPALLAQFAGYDNRRR
jgi:60 kDa SS-A/Ro ribonucleoprotein